LPLQGSKSFFSEIIASISDISFSRDGRYVLSRDYMNLKLWDLAMEARPVVTLAVHEELRPRVSGRTS
jgi:serine/threonine-protein phosphatase 2A regulatory subunit B